MKRPTHEDLDRDWKETRLYTCRLGHTFEDYVSCDPGWCPRHDGRADRCGLNDNKR